MPLLDGTAEDRSVIRTYWDFAISFSEFVGSTLDTKALIRSYIRRGVEKICYDCVRQGYYILSLEKGYIEEVSSDIATKRFRLELGVYVREFPDKLTGDELFYYANKASEGILFEWRQLGGVIPKGAEYGIVSDKTAYPSISIMSPKYTISVDPAVETGVARALLEQSRVGSEAAKQKVQKYKIIRRPKCSLTSG